MKSKNAKLVLIVILTLIIAAIVIPYIIGSMHRAEVQKVLTQGDGLIAAGKYSEAFEVYLRAKTINVSDTFSAVIKEKLKALSERWYPSNNKDSVRLLIASGKYQEAAKLGDVAVEPLIEEFRQVNEPAVRSQLCAILLKTGDKRALDAVDGYLRQKLDKIGAIVRETIPVETQVSTTMEKVGAKVRRVVVAGHLLEGEKADDKSPYVRGDYTNKERLEAKAKYRTYEIYRGIFRDVPMTEFHSVVVQCRHGVRVQMVPFGSPAIPGSRGTDQAMTIFETSLTPEAAQNINWQNVALSDVERIWTEESNLIPSLQFIAVPGGGFR